jgi:hypothetical protein
MGGYYGSIFHIRRSEPGLQRRELFVVVRKGRCAAVDAQGPVGDPGNKCITIALLYRIQALLPVVVILMRSKQVVFRLRALLSYGFKLVE